MSHINQTDDGIIGTASQAITSCIYFGIYRKAERRIYLEDNT